MTAMKRFFNYFYTTLSKTITVILIMIFVWLSSSNILNSTVFYNDDAVAVINVFRQWSHYDYSTSEFLDNEIKSAISDVLVYSLHFAPTGNQEEDLAKYYQNGSIDQYRLVKEHLDSLQNFRFAVVNHDTDTVISNIEDLNGKTPDAAVRGYFGGNEKSLLIVHNARNPYYESGTMVDYVDYVRELSVNYADDFDLYVSFGENLSFAGDGENFRQRHATALEIVKASLFRAAVYALISLVLIALLVITSGKREIGGKTYLTISDKIPNDMMFVFFLIIFISMSVLFENSVYMIVRASSYDGVLWFTYSPEYYYIRANISLLILVFSVIISVCGLKRQAENQTLLTNTYLYKRISAYKNRDIQQ